MQMDSSVSLAGRSALVTGGGRGFGRAIASALAGAGAAVTITGRTASELDETVAMIEADGGRAAAARGDVRNPDDVSAAVAHATKSFGPVDLLVNNAGVDGPYGPVGVVDPVAWWAAMEVHLRAPLLFMSAALPNMRSRGQGTIVNIVSKGAVRVERNLSAYCTGKAAATRLTEHVGAETRGSGIAAFALHPGDAVTAFAHATLTNPDAQRWRPEMIDILKEWQKTVDSEGALKRCGEVCIALASGAYDGLSGRYIEAEQDLDLLLAEAE
jgi:NAD(P)-dependent dehydrogenase (short-subunit alcohol dehydrogenase family)